MTVVDVEVSRGERPWPVAFSTSFFGRTVLYGYALKESTGTASAEVDFYGGNDTKGGLFIPITLQANESVVQWFGPQGLRFREGLYANLVSGAITGSLFIWTPGGYGRGW